MNLPPSSHLEPSSNPPASIITVHCELVRGTESIVTEKLIPRVQRQSISLDLSSVERIDAAGIAALITLYCSSVETGHEFRVIDPSPHVLELLRIVGLESILVIPAEAGTAIQHSAETLRCCAA